MAEENTIENEFEDELENKDELDVPSADLDNDEFKMILSPTFHHLKKNQNLSSL